MGLAREGGEINRQREPKQVRREGRAGAGQGQSVSVTDSHTLLGRGTVQNNDIKYKQAPPFLFLLLSTYILGNIQSTQKTIKKLVIG